MMESINLENSMEFENVDNKVDILHINLNDESLQNSFEYNDVEDDPLKSDTSFAFGEEMIEDTNANNESHKRIEIIDLDSDDETYQQSAVQSMNEEGCKPKLEEHIAISVNISKEKAADISLNDSNNIIRKRKINMHESVDDANKNGIVQDARRRKRIYNESKDALNLQSDPDWKKNDEDNDSDQSSESVNINSADCVHYNPGCSVTDSNNLEEKRVTRSQARATCERTPQVISEEVKINFQTEKIPVIKNGNSTTLCAVKIDEETASVSNTCAFDSLLQIFLTASYDYEIIRSQVDTLASKTDIFKVIQYIKNKGVNSYMYSMRAHILKKHFEMQDNPESENEKLLDCLCNIGSMTKKLLECVPSFTETSVCENGCTPRVKRFVVYPIELCHLINPQQNKYIIEDCVNICHHTGCIQNDCDGIEETILSIGNIVMLDVPIDTQKKKIQIKKLSQELDIPMNHSQCLKLAGFVDMDVRAKHYTAVVYRQAEDKWCRLDDLVGKVQYISDDTLVRPALLIYIKVDR